MNDTVATSHPRRVCKWDVIISVVREAIMIRKVKIRAALAGGVALATLAVGFITLTPAIGSANTTPNVITIAEGANATPNYILPFYPPANCTITNTSQFQNLMYRPLYFYGLANSTAVVPSLSTGDAPVYSNGNKTVTINMKGWKFADGQTIDAESVLFFLNMYDAVPSGFCTYTKGLGIPDQVANATATGNTVVIHLKSPVSPLWFTNNELATITPMANSWDVTSATKKSDCASGKYGAASTIAACKAVQAYLTKQGANTSTFTDKLWQSGVSGPWTLIKMDTLGNAEFQANTKYSGPQKAQVKYVKLVAFTSSTALQNQLEAGNIDLGVVDPSVLTSDAPAPGKVGANWAPLAAKFNLVSYIPYSNNYMNLNFGKNPGAVFLNQLYVRAALESSIDQAAIIKSADKNYAFATDSAVPVNTPSTEIGKVTDPYPYDMAAAAADFSKNGWTLTGGTLACTSPGTASGECGTGITMGENLTLNVEYYSGIPSLTTEMNAIIANWTTLGITIKQTTGTFDDTAGTCPVAYNAATTEDICNWGGGWLYAPDYYPSGEPLYLTGAGSNSGLYSNPTMDSLIKATLSTNVKLTAFAQFSAVNLPELWDPVQTATNEVIKTLKSSSGGIFEGPLETFTPEYWSFK
jgi:peptide/nickel transport system substrate-binding protein